MAEANPSLSVSETVTEQESQSLSCQEVGVPPYKRIQPPLKNRSHHENYEFRTENHQLVRALIITERSASPRVTLKLKKPKNDKKVKWTTETVDNEHLNKKKSKCCCVYEKPRMFGESSSEDEDDCTGHCRGHKDHCYRADGGNNPGPSRGRGGMGQPSGSRS